MISVRQIVARTLITRYDVIRVWVWGWVRVMVEFRTSSAFRGWVRVRVLLPDVAWPAARSAALWAFCRRQNAPEGAHLGRSVRQGFWVMVLE